MIDLFTKIIELGVAASFLILAVLCLHPLLKKVPKWITCLLWGMVALRLIVPISPQSELSLVPSWAKVSLQRAERAGQIDVQTMGNVGQQEESINFAAQGSQAGGQDSYVLSPRADGQDPVTPGIQAGGKEPAAQEIHSDDLATVDQGMKADDHDPAFMAHEIEADGQKSERAEVHDLASQEARENQNPDNMGAEDPTEADCQAGKRIPSLGGTRLLRVASAIWTLGMLICLAYALFSYMRISRKVSDGIRLPDGTYESRKISSPFILGMLRPRIYLPVGLSKEARDCILCHERAHLSRGDQLWKPLGFLILSAYWFHPLVWISYHLFCKDIELACDEKAIGKMDQERRATYCQTLLDLSSETGTSYACPLAFGEGDAKGRIQSVLNHKKAPRWLTSGALLLCLAVGICFMTNPASKAADEGGTPQESMDLAVEGKEAISGGEDEGNTQSPEERSEEDHVGESYVSLASEITSLESAARILGNLPLYYCDGDETRAIRLTDVPALFHEESDPYFQCWCFSIVDLDGDGAEEVILQCYGAAGDSGGKVILHQIGDKVYVYTTGYRMMWEIYEDGTYFYSGWIMTNDGYARITEFTESGYEEDRFTYATGSHEGADTFVVDHQPVRKGDYEKAMTVIRSKRKTDIYQFNEENLKRIITVFHAGVISTWNADFKKFAYGIVKEEDGAREFMIGVSNVDGSDARERKLYPELGNELSGIWWLSDGTVGVELHVNPSTSEFIVFDLENGLEVRRYFGSSFTVIPGTNHVAYEGNVPHFGKGDAYHSYFIDDKKVYTSKLLNASLGTLYFSEDLSTITFREVVHESGEERNMIGDFDLQGLRISNVMEETETF